MDSPSVPAGYFLFGLCHVKHREWEKAADAFQITLKKIPSHGAALNNLGAIYLLKGDKKNAIDCFENALYLFPGYLDAKENLRLSQEERNPTVDEIKITWRQLRSVLTVYGD
jgi:tetratricopeptide (TPR) repeat protein